MNKSTKPTEKLAECGNKSKPLLAVVLLDKNGLELENGSVINIHQTVNGENLFVMLDVKELDLRYGFEISYKYQYDVLSLLEPNKLNGDIEWEIVGSLHSFLGNYR